MIKFSIPHVKTACIADYEITFSANTPKITYSYIKRKQGRIQEASIYIPHGHAFDSIELIVNERAPAGVISDSWQTLAGIDYWPSSLGWKKTSSGIKEIAELKFAVTHWIGKQARTYVPPVWITLLAMGISLLD